MLKKQLTYGLLSAVIYCLHAENYRPEDEPAYMDSIGKSYSQLWHELSFITN